MISKPLFEALLSRKENSGYGLKIIRISRVRRYMSSAISRQWYFYLNSHRGLIHYISLHHCRATLSFTVSDTLSRKVSVGEKRNEHIISSSFSSLLLRLLLPFLSPPLLYLFRFTHVRRYTEESTF